ncbi:hypothetical protein PRUPE_7G080200 [Prunus persica]|uniref:DNA-3-methyladenine glycosylase II n=1 Tax=Prunus persica TaxID=3760 RepID=A0A251NAH3_PRUPE|nr:hypothetical protein PRUPE_7G080200 [Prunus persica]
MLMRDEMKRTRRSKQVTAKSSKSPIPANRIRDEDDDEAWPSQPSESLAVTVVNPKKSKSQLQTKPGSIPDNPPEEMTILPFTFFQIDALDLAPRLLGKFLRRDDVVLQITEVEAYRQNDSACHGRFGVTARTAPVFGPGGNAYVYLCYGLHTMLNVVADKEGVGAAVLIRSCAPDWRPFSSVEVRRLISLCYLMDLERSVKHWDFLQNGLTIPYILLVVWRS